MVNVVDESISLITMWNIVSQLGKDAFSCGSVLTNLKDRKLLSDQMNKNCFDPNLHGPNSAVNEKI